MVTDRSAPPMVKCRDRMGIECFINFNSSCRIGCQAAKVLRISESKMLPS